MTAIDDLATAGTSTWLDDLSRERLESGNLEEIIATKSIVGVTTNPAIFAHSIKNSSAYDADIEKLKNTTDDPAEAVFSLAIDDVRAACDIFADIYQSSGGKDGRVSIEVDPRISDDAAATIAQARHLAQAVGRENVMIKIPATKGSLPAIVEALSEGISVNVTLIFSVDVYREVIEAYQQGITKAAEKGLDVSKIHSVASFFVSRLDVEIDKRLEAMGTQAALDLRGQAGVANAVLAYQLFREKCIPQSLPEGAHLQRPLWASTGVKNPDYPQDMYVTKLAGPDTVNTMPEPTIDAVLENNNIVGDTLTDSAESAQQAMQALQAIGIDFDDVMAQLEREGVEKFVDSWNDLLHDIDKLIKS